MEQYTKNNSLSNVGFWRIVNKVMFTVSLIVCLLAVLISSIALWVAVSLWFGLGILIGGTIFILCLFSWWGIMLDHIRNVEQLRKVICTDNSEKTKPSIPTYDNPQQTLINRTPAKQEKQPYSSNGKWTCLCGSLNNSMYCFKCGRHRDSMKDL